MREIFFTDNSSKMKNNKDLENDVQDSIKSKMLLNSSETGIIAKVGENIKKMIYITSLAGMGLFLNSCLAGYVLSEPVYVEYARPPRPTNLHIWIDGDWAYNNQTHVYLQKTGYWQKPNQGQTYVTGYWKSTPKGKAWAPGHWLKETNKRNKSRR